MKIGKKYSFIDTININNINFIRFINKEYYNIYLELLNKIYIDINNLDNDIINILGIEDTNILKDYFNYKDMYMLSNKYNINSNYVYQRIKVILDKLIKYINYLISYKMYINNMNNIPIEILQLKSANYNILKRLGINTLNSLINYPLDKLLLNKIWLDDLISKVHNLNLCFKDEELCIRRIRKK